ncbi:MAG: dihydrofolate reductase [Candidatus Izimaplasma sp.]|nr:dihydrofolate reductase [Candidatus Izimaplasma bacterium]
MISLIVAMDKNRCIGKGNKLPWHYKEDLQYFKKTTMNKTVIMGEKTFESILAYLKKPLPNRTSVIASKTHYAHKDCETTDNIVDYLKRFPKDQEIFIIGGKTIYDITLDLADRLYITHINKEFDGDVFFREIDYSKYKTIKKETNGDLTFAVYERIK